jgi:hypothetical protein
VLGIDALLTCGHRPGTEGGAPVPASKRADREKMHTPLQAAIGAEVDPARKAVVQDALELELRAVTLEQAG